MEQEVLIKIELPNVEDADKKIDSLTSSITDLTDANKELKKENDALAKSGEKNSQQYIDNAKQIEINKQKIQENTASRKGLIQVQVAEENSIKALRVQNTELIKQRDLINTKTDEGKAKIAAINRQIDLNTKEININSSSMEKQKMNIGNYASALDGLIPGFSGFISGIQGATKAGMAFLATPIGIAIGLVAAAIGTLSAAIKTDDAVADEFGKTWDQINGVFDVVVRRIGLVGKSLFELKSGNLEGAFKAATDSVSGFGDEVSRAWDLTGQLADRQNQLDDELNKFNATEKERINTIRQLEIASKDRTKSEEERIKLNQQAADLEDKLTKERTALTERQSAIEIEAIGLKNDIQKEANETTKEYGLRLLENSKIGGETAETIAKAISAIDEAQSSSIAKQEKLINQRNALLEKQREEEAKIYEDAKKLADEQFAADIERVKQLEADKALVKQQATSLEQENIEIEQDAKEEVYIKDWKAYSDNEKLKTKVAKLEAQNRLDVISNTLGQAQSLFKEDSFAYKLLGIARATVDTYRAANLALASYPPPFGGIAAAVAIATGLANVSKISKAAGGGNFLTKGPTLLLVGDNPGGVERVTVEPLSGKGRTVINPNSNLKPDIAMAGGGSMTVIGGSETRIAASRAQGAFDIGRMSDMINQIKIVQVVQDFEAAQMAKNEPIVMAQVVGR